ncbi:MAG: hypothetical protein RI826_08320 [Chlorobium phaeovibrioides]|nr:hypothetical protein [Chlorobium phaeovibrioides]
MKSLLESFLEKAGAASSNNENSKTQTRKKESPDTFGMGSIQSKNTFTKMKEAPDRELLALRFRRPAESEISLVGVFAENRIRSNTIEAKKTLTEAREHPDTVKQSAATQRKTITDVGRESPDQEFIPRRRI